MHFLQSKETLLHLNSIHEEEIQTNSWEVHSWLSLEGFVLEMPGWCSGDRTLDVSYGTMDSEEEGMQTNLVVNENSYETVPVSLVIPVLVLKMPHFRRILSRRGSLSPHTFVPKERPLFIRNFFFVSEKKPSDWEIPFHGSLEESCSTPPRCCISCWTAFYYAFLSRLHKKCWDDTEQEH